MAQSQDAQGAANAEPKTPAEFIHARATLRAHGYYAREILRVWSAGESGEDADIVLYISDRGEPKTARFHNDVEHERVIVLVESGF